jgi:hypothetical protein
MKIALGVVMLGATLSAAPSYGGESQSTLPQGEWSGDALGVRWRASSHSSYAPETVVVVENRSTAPIVVVFDWQIRVCGGESVRLEESASRFASQLFGADPLSIHSTLAAGEWDALVFPRGLPGRSEKDANGCVSRVAIQTYPKMGGDRFVLTLPAPRRQPGERR